MGYPGECAGGSHSIQKFLLVRTRAFAGKFDLDIQGTTVTNTMTHDVGLAVVAHVDHTAVLGEELPDGVVSSDAAVLAQSDNDLVLKNRFFIDVNRLPCGWRSGSLYCFFRISSRNASNCLRYS